jgi:Na+-transporting methylmalonyl-CoA/oxaloacetate decarboxylase gamma subunit
MLKRSFSRLLAGIRHEPIRLLPLVLGVFMFLLFSILVAATGGIGKRIAEHLPEELPEPLSDEVAFAAGG